jgi:signal transduction histidine kinase
MTDSESAPVIQKQREGSLQRLGQPFRWWFTPRSNEPDEAFRERSLRWIIPLGLLFTAFNLGNELAAKGTIAFTSASFYAVLCLTYLAASVFLLRGKIDRAAYTIAALFVVVFALDQERFYWSPAALGEAALIMLLFALILPKNKFLLLAIVLVYTAFNTHLVFPLAPSLLPAGDPFATQIGAFIASALLFLGGGGIVFFLLRQYARQSDQLRSLVQTLEDRVLERTRQLEDAKNDAETARERAEQADRVKSQFLASMSHELRTPLNAILTFNELMAQGIFGPVNHEQEDYLQKSLKSGRHLLALINDVLDLSKIQSGMLKLFIEDGFDIGREMISIAETAESLLQGKPVSLVRDFDPEFPAVSCDKRRVRQVLLNLVANAAKFTAQGTITLSAKRREREVLFAVIDTGPGIPLADQSKIFDPFVQTEAGMRHGGGTGLGLPITKNLVEAHGGRIWVESVLGEGAAFFVVLPFAAPQVRRPVDQEMAAG